MYETLFRYLKKEKIMIYIVIGYVLVFVVTNILLKYLYWMKLPQPWIMSLKNW